MFPYSLQELRLPDSGPEYISATKQLSFSRKRATNVKESRNDFSFLRPTHKNFVRRVFGTSVEGSGYTNQYHFVSDTDFACLVVILH